MANQAKRAVYRRVGSTGGCRDEVMFCLDTPDAAGDFVEGAHLHQPPPHDGVAAVAVADDGELRFGRRRAFEAEGGRSADTVWMYRIVSDAVDVNVDIADVNYGACLGLPRQFIWSTVVSARYLYLKEYI
ncbi:hypothetical protein LMG7141_04095 [Ralstonia condita]|uniref:Uncharacterized protein n=1 Tax=Ralstonia condita TaxID=3058600 RepID=A0ABM9JRY6_9RALS|nr:hypothetical protein [Ralstonia sp. LMG 7141]CAJ0802334.1 hypothetical protein LMG7141_04095 [Ralstonia sp. LMG 7141]